MFGFFHLPFNNFDCVDISSKSVILTRTLLKKIYRSVETTSFTSFHFHYLWTKSRLTNFIPDLGKFQCLVQFPKYFKFPTNIAIKSDILHSDSIMSQWLLVRPRKYKTHHSVLVSNFNCDPDATRQLLFKFKKVSLIITFVANCSSRGCWTITATVSSSDDAYVCRIGTNPATCDRSTVAQSAATAAPKTFSHSLKSRRKMGRR